MSVQVDLQSQLTERQVSTTAGHWLEVMSHIEPKYGGLSAAVPSLGSHLAQIEGVDVSLAAFCWPNEALTPPELSAKVEISFWPVHRAAWLSNVFALRSQTEFADLVRQCDGIHIHGLWEGSTALASSRARKHDVPYVLSAHGMLEPWALRSSRIKKLIYSSLIERPNVQGAACLHALTNAEAEQFVRFGARSPIAVIPNGVDIPAHRDASLFLNLFPKLRGRRLVLFLARLHRKKGLDLLIDAWSKLAELYPDAHLVLAGPDCEGTQSSVEHIIKAHRMDNTVTFTGMLRDSVKWSAFAAAEGFVLPSYSEGLSVSVLEAMGMGLPVIVTDACNMPEVVQTQAGWQIQQNAASLAGALDEFLVRTPEQNRQTGARGAQLIRNQYTWPNVARKMADLYAWVSGGVKPASFEVVQP